MKKIPVIIDTDPGVDDVFALLIAFKNKKLDVKLVCSTAGNVNIENTTNNTLYITKKYSPNTLVAKGIGSPLQKEFVDASDVHGESGVGGFVIPKHNYKLDYDDVILAMKEVIEKSTEKVTIITLGPITNLASFIKACPNLLNKIECVYSMIASVDGSGNVTPYAEFNSYCDPEALDIVVKSGLNIVFVPKQVGEITMIEQKRFFEMGNKNETSKMIVEILSGFHEKAVDSNYAAIYDQNAVFALTNPKYYKFMNCDVTVNVSDEKRGQTFINIIKNKKSNLRCVFVKNPQKLSNAIFKELYR